MALRGVAGRSRPRPKSTSRPACASVWRRKRPAKRQAAAAAPRAVTVEVTVAAIAGAVAAATVGETGGEVHAVTVLRWIAVTVLRWIAVTVLLWTVVATAGAAAAAATVTVAGRASVVAIVLRWIAVTVLRRVVVIVGEAAAAELVMAAAGEANALSPQATGGAVAAVVSVTGTDPLPASALASTWRRAQHPVTSPRLTTTVSPPLPKSAERAWQWCRVLRCSLQRCSKAIGRWSCGSGRPAMMTRPPNTLHRHACKTYNICVYMCICV
jgi:hypothetical protein